MQRISIIIPVLNEEKNIGRTLDRIDGKAEVIIVDGGSNDRTLDIVKKRGIKIILSPVKRRSYQMNLGARAATGDILLFLHGDTLLPENYRDNIIRTLEDKNIIAGAFSLKIDGEDKKLRIVETMVNIRSRLFSLPYGDQGLFLRAETFEQLGGFPDLPIMEDFEFVLNLRKRGKIYLIPEPVLTSGRRWRKLGVWRTTLINQLVILGYYLKVPPDRLVKLYGRK